MAPATPIYQTYKTAAQAKLLPGQQLAFAAGKGYYGKPMVGAAPAPPGPTVTSPASSTAPTTAPPVSLSDQARQIVLGEIQPIIDSINQTATQRINAGSGAITGYTGQLAKALAGVDYTAPYQAGIQDTASVDSALHDALTGAGNTSAQSLAAALGHANVNPDQVKAAVDKVTQTGVGSGNTTLGLGSAALDQLIANRTAAAAYGSRLPGIMQLAGAQQIGNLTGQVATEANNQLTQIRNQIPTLARDIYNQLATEQQRQQTAAMAAQKVNPTLSRDMGVMVNDYGRAITGSDGKPVPYTPYTKPPSSAMHVFGDATGGYFGLDPATGKVTKLTTGTGPKQAAPKVFGGAKSGYYTLDPATGKVTQIVAPAASSGGSGAAKLQHVTVNGHVYTFDPSSGTFSVPGTNVPVDPNSVAAPVKVSAKQLSDARAYLQQSAKGFYASQVDPTKPLTSGEIAAAAKTAGMSVSQFLANSKAMAAAGIGWNQVNQHEDPHIQDLYVTLVKRYGIPAKQAFELVGGTYKAWADHNRAGYFPNQGKGSAAAETAAPRGLQAALSPEGAGGVYRPPWNQTLTPSQRTQIAQQALEAVSKVYATPSNIKALVGRINQESGGQTAVVNKWDSNWKAGMPSIGLLQTIPSTFQQYAAPGHTDIWDPLDNTIAAVRYMLDRYGQIVGPSGSGY